MGARNSSPDLDTIRIRKLSDPNSWTEDEVVKWLSKIDGGHFNDKKLLNKFKKHRINGRRLMNLDCDTLKNQLKVKERGIRLDILKSINKQKAIKPYPSPMYINKYQNNPIPNKKHNKPILSQKTSLSSSAEQQQELHQNSYNNNNNNNNIDTIRHLRKDRGSWTVGTEVLIYCQAYDCWTEGLIESITDPVQEWLLGTCKGAQNLFVSYDLGNGIERKQMPRYYKTIKSIDKYIINRLKLHKHCIVDIFDDKSQKWVNGYIEKVYYQKPIINNQMVQSNQSKQYKLYPIFVICLVKNPQIKIKLSRWSDKLRVSKDLLTLKSNVGCQLFSWETQKWHKSLITDVFQSYHKNVRKIKLDLFKVIYFNKLDSKHYFKYLHQFSWNISHGDIYPFYPTEYSDLTIAIYTEDIAKNIKQDPMDTKYRNLLIAGYIRNKNLSTRETELLTFIMKQRYYIGPSYGLIMYLESKYHKLNTSIS